MNKERQLNVSDEELEQALFKLGRDLAPVPSADLASVVGSYLRAHPQARRSFQLHQVRRRLLYPAVIAVALVLLTLATSSRARTTVASWLHIGGVRIESVSSAPGPLGRNLALGHRTTLSYAEKTLPFRIWVPTLRKFRRPDEVYVATPPMTDSVSLLYGSRAGMSRAAASGATLLIGESSENLYVAKMVANAPLEPVSVGGAPGVWIGGAHYLYYLDPRGRELADTIRLVGNTLVWQVSGITFRIEGRISRVRAIQIARSMKVKANQ